MDEQAELLAAIDREHERLEHNLVALRHRIESLGQLGEEMKAMSLESGKYVDKALSTKHDEDK